MLNKGQVKLLQTAVRAAGIREPKNDSRYRMLLRRYMNRNRWPINSCKELSNAQMDDVLAICESMGWKDPTKPANYYRAKIARSYNVAGFALQEAIRHLAGDLGWNDANLAGMIGKMSGGATSSLAEVSPGLAYQLIEAMKAMLSRKHGVKINTLQEAAKLQEATDGQGQTG